MLTEDELARSAPLERIFPTQNTHKYLTFTDSPRYYNRLLDAYENRYSHNRVEGIALIQSYCEKKIHLQVPPPTIITVRKFHKVVVTSIHFTIILSKFLISKY